MSLDEPDTTLAGRAAAQRRSHDRTRSVTGRRWTSPALPVPESRDRPTSLDVMTETAAGRVRRRVASITGGSSPRSVTTVTGLSVVDPMHTRVTWVISSGAHGWASATRDGGDAVYCTGGTRHAKGRRTGQRPAGGVGRRPPRG